MNHKNSMSRFTVMTIVLFVAISIIITNCQEPEQNLITNQMAESFQKTLNQKQQELKIPGVSAAMILSDNSTWIGVSGKSSDTEDLHTSMLFGIGSITMTYTATLILQLEKEGLLSLEDTIGKFISKLGKIDGNITIHQLLDHTSGLYRYQQTPEFQQIIFSQPDKIWTPYELIETFQGEPVCPPGACWGESAMDHILLGAVIEKITGSSISNQLHTKILEPYNLENTFLYPEQSYTKDKMAHFWWDNFGSSAPVDVLAEDSAELPMASLFSSVWAAGGMHSTAKDLARFIKYLFEGKITGKKTLGKMVTPTTEIDENVYYGYSVIIEQIKGKTVYWHTGGIGYSSIYCYFPDNKLSIAVLCNQMIDPKSISIELFETYLENCK